MSDPARDDEDPEFAFNDDAVLAGLKNRHRLRDPVHIAEIAAAIAALPFGANDTKAIYNDVMAKGVKHPIFEHLETDEKKMILGYRMNQIRQVVRTVMEVYGPENDRQRRRGFISIAPIANYPRQWARPAEIMNSDVLQLSLCRTSQQQLVSMLKLHAGQKNLCVSVESTRRTFAEHIKQLAAGFE